MPTSLVPEAEPPDTELRLAIRIGMTSMNPIAG